MDRGHTTAGVVHLGDREPFDIARTDRGVGALEAPPGEREALTPRGEYVRSDSRRAHVEHHAQGLKSPVAIEVEMHQCPTVALPESRRVDRGDAFPVPSVPRRHEAVRGPRRRVGDEGGRRRLGGELVEAGEGLGVALGVEELVARYEAIGSKDPEYEKRNLESAAAHAIGARGV